MAIGAGLGLRVFGKTWIFSRSQNYAKIDGSLHGGKYFKLSLFAFSTENWKRPKDEIDFIFELLDRCLDEALENLKKIMCV